MADRIQFRRDTAARWAEFNPILLEGEIGYILDDMTHYKMGDGVNSWNNLPLRGHDVNIVQSLGNDENSVISQKIVTEQISNLNKKIDEFKPVIPDTPTTGGVTGVKGNAESVYRQGNVNITPANIGLGNVNNTSDEEKSVKHATSASQDDKNRIFSETYAEKSEIDEIKNDADAAVASSSNALALSEEAIRTSNTAKNSVATLEGLSNTTTAQQTLAEQVVQIEENKQYIGLINVNLEDYSNNSCCLGKDGWYSEAGKGKHKVIPLSNVSFVEITCGDIGQYIGFVTSGYITPSSGQAVPYSEYEPYRIWQYENTTTRYKVPSDAAYLVLGTEDGAGKLETYNSIKLYTSSGIFNKLNKSLIYSYKEVNLNDISPSNCSLGTNGWYYMDGNGIHKVIPVKGYTKVQIKVTGGNNGGWFGFLTSDYVTPEHNDAIPYSYRYPSRLWQYADTIITYDLCPDIEYLVVCVVDGGGNKPYFEVWLETDNAEVIQHSITQINKKIRTIEKASNSVPSPVIIDFNSLSESVGCLGSKGWYIDDLTNPHHKAISVKGGTSISITITGTWGTYLGFLTSAYKIPSRLDESIPYCNETPERIWQYENTTVTYKIPSDCSYVVVSTVDGAGIQITYGDISIYGYDGATMSIQEFASNITEAVENLKGSTTARLRILGWNIGHYCYGTGVDTNVTDANYLEQRTAYRQLFNKYGADLLGLIEYSNVFNSSTGESASTAIIPQYSKKLFGDVKNGGYVCNGIVTNLDVTNISQILLPNDYYAIEGDVTYMGSKFKVVVTHLPWQTEEMNVEAAQILINKYANEDKVVIIGDFNIYDTSLYDSFADAGYNMANHGYLGDVVTRPETGTFLDNIMVKGGKIIHTEFDNSTLSDHLPVIVDIVI